MDDLISRQAAIDAVDGVDWYHINENGKMVHGANDAEHQAWYKADDIYAAIERVPPAVPVAKDTNVPSTDTISRQQAIATAVSAAIDWHRLANPQYSIAYSIGEAMRALPPAQQWISCEERLPEDYTDVLVWFEYYRYGDYNRLYQMHGIGNYMSEYDSWMINHETGWRKLRVLAWCPLPEPYREDTP